MVKHFSLVSTLTLLARALPTTESRLKISPSPIRHSTNGFKNVMQHGYILCTSAVAANDGLGGHTLRLGSRQVKARTSTPVVM